MFVAFCCAVVANSLPEKMVIECFTSVIEEIAAYLWSNISSMDIIFLLIYAILYSRRRRFTRRIFWCVGRYSQKNVVTLKKKKIYIVSIVFLVIAWTIHSTIPIDVFFLLNVVLEPTGCAALEGFELKAAKIVKGSTKLKQGPRQWGIMPLVSLYSLNAFHWRWL